MNYCYCCLRIIFTIKRKIENYFYSEEEKHKLMVSPAELPWLWLGAELKNNMIISLTDDINKVVMYGDLVTPDYLESYTELGNVRRWLYLDSKTLIEKEIPTKGLLIEQNDTK